MDIFLDKKRKIESCFFVLFVFILFSAVSVHSQENTNVSFSTSAKKSIHVELTQQQHTVYQQLQTKASNLDVSWDKRDALPGWVSMTDLQISWRSPDYSERAYQFLDQYGIILTTALPMLQRNRLMPNSKAFEP